MSTEKKQNTDIDTDTDIILLSIWCNKNSFNDKFQSKLIESGLPNLDSLRKCNIEQIIKTLTDSNIFNANTTTAQKFKTAVENLKKEPEIKSIRSMKTIKNRVSVEKWNAVALWSYNMQGSSHHIRTSKIHVEENVGLRVGGALDMNTFRNSIKNLKMPQLNSVSSTAMFNDYYFDKFENKNENVSDNLFYPSYCFAKCKVPDVCNIKHTEHDSKEYEYYAMVSLNSNLNKHAFKRKKLNLVIVLDISNSMGRSFQSKSNQKQSKMTTANKCVIALLKRLNNDDRFGLVVFSDWATVIQPLKFLKNVTMREVERILSIEEGGGTNFEDGYQAGMDLFKSVSDDEKVVDNFEYDNRLIFLTDAKPNIGKKSTKSLLEMVQKAGAQERRIYTSFIGIGVNFNVNLIGEITKVRGANYMAVHSNSNFIRVMDDEFDYMVTPLIFDLKIMVKAEGSSTVVDSVYGSNKDLDNDKGEIMRVYTLFPSPDNKEDEGQSKGGVILLKLKNMESVKSHNLEMFITFEDQNGKICECKQNLSFDVVGNKDMIENGMDGYYDNVSIRKGILLLRYVKLLRKWIFNDRKYDYVKYFNQLYVSKKYKEIFKNFITFLEREMIELNDEECEKELMILRKLQMYSSQTL